MAARYSREERRFIRTIAPYARDSHIADALGRSSAQAVWDIRRRFNIAKPARGNVLSAEAVNRAWQRFGKGEDLRIENLLFWSQEHGRRFANNHKRWTLGDEELLQELAGRESLLSISRKLKRTRGAVLCRAQRLGLVDQVFRFTTGRLGALLNVSRHTVRTWCNEGKLRGYFERTRRIVHVDDAEWIIENYKYAGTDWRKLQEEVWSEL